MREQQEASGGRLMRQEVFSIREVRPDWEVQQTGDEAHYGQAKVFDQFMALVKRAVALGCLLEGATYEYRREVERYAELTRIRPSAWKPTEGEPLSDAPLVERRERLMHVYEWRGAISGPQEAMARLMHQPPDSS